MDFGLYLINEASHDESNSKISTLSHPLDTMLHTVSSERDLDYP